MRHIHRFAVLGLLFLWAGVSQGAFKFVGWADNRPGVDASNRARFQWVLQEMNRISGAEPAFHIVPGDFDTTPITSADIANLSNVKTWYFAPGNHDTTELDTPNWSTNVGNAHFAFINEYDEGVNGGGRACDHVYNWLVNDLNANTKPAVFVVGHEPAFPQYRHIGESLDRNTTERDRFWALLNQHKVIAYLCGHTHYYSTFQDATGPTVQIDLGNAGNPSDASNPQTYALFNVTDTSVDVYVYHGMQNNAFTGGYSFSIPIPVASSKATNPSPASGVVNVPTNVVLSWTAGVGAVVSHDVYFGTSAPPAKVTTQSGTSYTPILQPSTQYYWRIDENYAGQTVTGDVWAFTTKATSTNCYVVGETPVSGTVEGSEQINNSDDQYESIREVLNSPGKNGYSLLEHIWRFNVVPGQHVEFRVEAYHSPSTDDDDFALAYSTDGLSYTSMLTVTKAADDNAMQAYTLPAGTSGTMYVKVRDTNHTKATPGLDTLYVDSMYILSSDTGGTATTMNASVATSTSKAGGPEVYGVATVTVTDNLGHAVSGATVAGTFTGDFASVTPGSKTTDANGQAIFDTGSSSLKRPVFGFDVTSVVFPGLVWQP